MILIRTGDSVEKMSALKYLKVPHIPNQKIFYPSLQLLDHKTSPLIWEHIIILRKKQHFDLLSIFFAESEIRPITLFLSSGILYNQLKSLGSCQGKLVRCNFMCQFECLWSFQIKHYSQMWLWRCFGMKLASKLVDLVGSLFYSMWWPPFNPLKDWIEIKVNEAEIRPLLSPLYCWTKTSHFTFSGIHSFDSSGFQTFELRLNSTDFSGSPACK